jgi:nickel-dependent lactate racemase
VVLGAVAGDLVYAHREGVRMARPYCEVEAEPADCVVVSAPLPVSQSLSRASRLIPPAGLLLRPGGAAIVAAECPEGAGPLAAMNEEILELGVRRYLPERCRIFLVSGMDQGAVAQTYATFAPSVAWALERARDEAGGAVDAIVVPDAADVVPRVRPPSP